jgi:type VI secretion system FHA domain protein
VILTLEITSPQSTKPGSSRHTFSDDGGTIGRDTDNAWVLPHSKVSGHHALISFRAGAFYIEDTRSTNGVRLNSSRNRISPGQPYAINDGDRILIDPYEIRVSITSDESDEYRAPRRRDEPRSMPTPPSAFDMSDPFELEDPFSPQPNAASGLDAPEESLGSEELDPLALLDLPARRTPPQHAPSAKDLERGSPLDAHFKPPAFVSVPSPTPAPAPARGPAPDAMMIPDDYDPLAPDEPSSIKVRPAPAPPPVRRDRPPPPPAPPSIDIFEPPRRPAPGAAVAPASSPAIPPAAPVIPVAPMTPPASIAPPAPVMPAPVTPAAPVAPAPPAPGVAALPTVNLAAVLEGAGLDPSDVTPELARTFGRILRVVVSGVMDVMRSRQQIKDEFRMRMTRFRTAENNPLKFSANVDDALHNLLVKRNAAYLGPVESFEDAFEDLRNHQIAMLAGMRVAFESMLAEFDPERMQEDFDRTNKGLVPAKLRYWDLFRERRQDLLKDPEATFRKLFGEEFARAYEEQLKQLKDKDH